MLMVITVYLSRTKLMFYMVRGGPNNTRIVKLMSGKEYQDPANGSGCFINGVLIKILDVREGPEAQRQGEPGPGV